MGMVGAVRVAWSFGENKLTGKMEMTPLKANIAPNTGGLEYQIVSEEVEINGQFISVGKIKFGNVTHASADAALKTPDKEAFVPLYKQCMDWLVEHLSDGQPHSKPDVYMSAEAMGYKVDTMKMARQKLGATVKYFKGSGADAPWYLQIEPKHEDEHEEEQ